MSDHPSFLLLQVRDADDPMQRQEVVCFARGLAVPEEAIAVHDLLAGPPAHADLDRVDIVLLGGSGDYSVVSGGPWLPAALETMAGLVHDSKPTFASCWGFQAIALALGGEVVTDRSRAEVGTIRLELTSAGESDPVFGPLGKRFEAQSGHEDIVEALPEGATLLASSDRVANEAFCFDGKPIYCTQFHPELTRGDLLARLRRYPAYLPLCGVTTYEELEAITPETPHTDGILRRFLSLALAVA